MLHLALARHNENKLFSSYIHFVFFSLFYHLYINKIARVYVCFRYKNYIVILLLEKTNLSMKTNQFYMIFISNIFTLVGIQLNQIKIEIISQNIQLWHR